eukprot:11819115-Alexandrium_andersonii.AAC.1
MPASPEPQLAVHGCHGSAPRLLPNRLRNSTASSSAHECVEETGSLKLEEAAARGQAVSAQGLRVRRDVPGFPCQRFLRQPFRTHRLLGAPC